jgi:hypothetical protein
LAVGRAPLPAIVLNACNQQDWLGNLYNNDRVKYAQWTGRVQRMLAVGDLLSNSELRQCFRGYLTKALAVESLNFITDVEAFRTAQVSTRAREACRIAEKYVVVGSEEQVNVSDNDRKLVTDVIFTGRTCNRALAPPPPNTLFDGCVKEVKKLLERDVMNRFLRSAAFKNCGPGPVKIVERDVGMYARVKAKYCELERNEFQSASLSRRKRTLSVIKQGW